MINLNRMLLIHWHYFTHELIEFDRINFLTGKNSSGKSTIIDAMQLILLSDTSGSFFNKAASGRGNRTLAGYLRCELGEDEGEGFRYLRNDPFTSYIVLEFRDNVKNSAFCVGCCFDTFGENDYQRLFFRLPGMLPENEFVVQNVPLTIEKLRVFIRANYNQSQVYTTGTNQDFREDLCGALGGLQTRKFTELIKKTVSFDPKADIRQFITEFVCGDELEINIAGMKENIRSYDSLKKASQVLRDQIKLLTDIGGSFHEYTRNRENEKLYGYLLARADLEQKEDALAGFAQEAARLETSLEKLRAQIAESENNQAQLQAERDMLKFQLDSNENARKLEELQKEIEEKKLRRHDLAVNFERVRARLMKALTSWESHITRIGEKLRDAHIDAVEPLLRERITALDALGRALLEDAMAFRGGAGQSPDAAVNLRDGAGHSPDAAVDLRGGAKPMPAGAAAETINSAAAAMISRAGHDAIIRLGQSADNYRTSCSGLTERMHEAQLGAAQKLGELIKEKESLEKGKYRFPQDAMDLKEAIESRLQVKFGPGAKAVVLAEAAEIKNDRWRNVIEGYLNTQKFYIIVAPEHFYVAFRLYDSIKRQKTVYATGLVDTEKLFKLAPSKDAGSLAEELETGDPAARVFIDYTLGRVMKCNDIKDLRKNRVSVTDDGMLYQNFVVRAMNPIHWKDPAIGLEGAKLRLLAVNREIETLRGELSVYASLIPAVKPSGDFMQIGETDAGQTIEAAAQYLKLPELDAVIKRLSDDAESIDKSEIENLRKRLAEREQSLRKVGEDIRRFERDCGAAEKELKICVAETIPALKRDSDAAKRSIESAYEGDWVDAFGGPRYFREKSARGDAAEITKAFPRELSRSRNAGDEAWNQTVVLRNKYNELYKTGHDPVSRENAAFDKLRADYEDIRLPEYEEKIEDTRSKAFQQFQEDFLSKLQSNIRNARQHIDEINASMKSASFGEDTYQFRVAANPDYKRYYDMIVDEMLLFGGYNLLSEQYNEKYRSEMTDLFEMLTNDSNALDSRGYEDYEKRVKTFTDYKTYLNFDLEVIKPGGETERLSRTMGKKSGGETQTPFYIAVLASFVQLYRVGRDRTNNTARIILFDEAFSKMDGERIIQSIELLRRFNFQAVFAAPPDKIPDIAALTDRNLCVLREGYKTCVRAFDPKRLEEFADAK